METEILHKKKLLAPKLRFNEFDGKWKSIIIGDYVISSAFGPRFSSDLYDDSGNVLTLRTTDMDNDGNICYDKVPLAKLNLDELKEHILLKDDLVISRSGTIGVTGIFQGCSIPVIPGAFLIRFRFKKDGLAPEFVRLYFNSSKGRNEIESLSAGGVQKNLTGTSVLKMSLVVPRFTEQQKIASFLSAVDEKIQKLTRKKELLEQYKKGVMQQLFSGKLRFKDENGKAFPKWEEKELNDLCEIARSGGTPQSTKKEFYNGDIPFLSISDMTSQGKYLKYTSNHISKLGLENSASWIVPANSIIYSMYASVGFVAINNVPIATSQAVLNLILKENINTEFIYYTLIDFQKKVSRFITTGTQGNLNAQTVKGFKIKLPCFEEQKRLADFLSNIDVRIENQNTQITQTQTFKKGMLQQMFV